MKDMTVPCHYRPKEKVERDKREGKETLQKKFKEIGLFLVAYVGKLNLGY